jgi:diadenosine tetraphosphate (Ap4A) HIT family hydrolase
MTAAAPDCVFCRIIGGTIPASVVHRDEAVIAFMDIGPVNPGHLLVAPTAHAASLADLEPRGGEQMFRLAQRLAGALRRAGIRCDGVNLFLADGAAAGQEVFHVHLHVVPRFRGDAVRFAWPRTQPSRDDLNTLAATIRAAL